MTRDPSSCLLDSNLFPNLQEMSSMIKKKKMSGWVWKERDKANRWGNSGWLYFSGLQITADGDCSHEIKRLLHFGRKVMTNPDSILKSRDITLPTKVRLIKAMVFPVVMYGCESWTVKKAEHRRIDAFELRCWEDSWESLGLQGGPTSQS